MEAWKRNLYILYIGQFLAMASTSCVTPFLPLYLQDIGLTEAGEIQLWTGLIYGGNLLTAFLFSPFWGKLADQYGRKLMLIRSGIGMAVTVTLMGFATSAVQLFILRLINGMLAGFGPAAVALTATNTPKERSGYALGVLHSGAVAGTICGPLLGGFMADVVGLSSIFFYMGISLFAATFIVIFWVRETFEKRDRKDRTAMRQDFKTIVSVQPIPQLFVSAFMVRSAIVGTLPLIPLYVQFLSPSAENLAFLAGLTASVMGIANMMSAPQLGKLADKIGSQYILLVSAFGAILFMIPQAYVQELWQLMVLRFCTGLCMGGLSPSINALIRRFAPKGMESRTYSYSNSAIFLGGLAGSTGMGIVAAWMGLPMIFWTSALLLVIHQVWLGTTVLPIMRKQAAASVERGEESKTTPAKTTQ